MEETEPRYFSDSKIKEHILEFDQNICKLEGLKSTAELDNFVEILANNANEIWLLSLLKHTILSDSNSNLDSDNFTPFTAALWNFQNNEIDEAYWLIFLQSYIGKNQKQNWNLLKGIYGSLDNENIWSWERVSRDVSVFQEWLIQNQPALNEKGSLGEIHKYPIMDNHNAQIMAKDIGNYVSKILEFSGHDNFIASAIQINEGNPITAFDFLFQSMCENVTRNKIIFFNYLSYIGTMGMAKINPGSFYLSETSLVKRGARLLLLGTNKNQKPPLNEVDEIMISLSNSLKHPLGIFILHQTLSQWSKEKFWNKRKSFRR